MVGLLGAPTASAIPSVPEWHYLLAPKSLPVRVPGTACTKPTDIEVAKLARTRWNTLLMCGGYRWGGTWRYHWTWVKYDANRDRVCTTDGYHRGDWFDVISAHGEYDPAFCSGPAQPRVSVRYPMLDT